MICLPRSAYRSLGRSNSVRLMVIVRKHPAVNCEKSLGFVRFCKRFPTNTLFGAGHCVLLYDKMPTWKCTV